MALLVWALVAEGRRGAFDIGGRRTPGRMRAIALLAVASQPFYVAAWIESRLASNIFLDRYLFPLSLVWMLAIAFVADSLVARLWQREPSPESERGKGIAFLEDGLWGRRLVLATAAVLTMFVATKTLRPRPPAVSEVEALQAIRELPGIPVATNSVLLHSELGWYRRSAGGQASGGASLRGGELEGRHEEQVDVLTGVVGLDDDGGASTRIPGDVLGMEHRDRSAVGEVHSEGDKRLRLVGEAELVRCHGESQQGPRLQREGVLFKSVRTYPP